MKQKIIFWAIAISMLFFNGCKDTQLVGNGESDINIEVCNTISPDWLIDEIYAIVDRVDNYRPVEVFSTNYENIEYVIITDNANSAISGAFQVFLCSGNSVQYGTDTYVALQQLFFENRENFIFLWSNLNTNQ
jgi:hypothetical protein